MKPRYFKNKYLNFIFTSEAVESFMFCVLCATVFTAGMCHWVLDVSYKYIASDPTLGKVDFNWVFGIGAIIAIYYLIRKRAIEFDFALVILCQTLVLVGVMDYHSERYDLVSYAWILPMAYILGKLAVGNDTKTANYRIEKLYFAMAIGIFIAGFLDFFMYYKFASIHGWFNTEKWTDFWRGLIEESRCTYELEFILISAVVGYFIYISKRNIFALVFMLQSNLVIQRLVIEAQGRENSLILPIGMATFVLLYVYDNWSGLSRGVKRSFILVVFALIFFFLLFWNAISHNLFGIYDRYIASRWAYWSGSGGLFTNLRFKYDLSGFKAMLEYPLGDYDLYGFQRPHSMLLEYGRAFDISIWGLLSIFRLLIIKDAIVLAFKRSSDYWIKYLLIPAFLSINLYYSMELNGYAHRYFWMIGLFLSGMIRGKLDKE